MIFELLALFTAATRSEIYEQGLQIATALGLPVTSWSVGDPARSLYHFVSAKLEAADQVAAEYAKGGYLDSAEGDWLTILADQVFNVQRIEATAATSDLVLLNSGGGVFYWDAGDLTFRSSATGKTYRNTDSGSLTSVGATATVTWVADEAGADSSVLVDEIDELVTAFPGVTIQSSAAGAASDAEEDEPLRVRCRASRGALSPNGPADAYRYVALSPDLTGVTDVTRVSVNSDSVTGNVTITLGGAGGPVAGASVTAVQDAITTWATPLCITPTVQNATAVPMTINLDVSIRASAGVTASTAQAAIAAAIADFVGDLNVGGNEGGAVDHDLFIGVAYSVYGGTYTTSVSRVTPASETTVLTANQVVVLAVAPIINVTIV